MLSNFLVVSEEVVYDQDNLILTSENYGDLIYTKHFPDILKAVQGVHVQKERSAVRKS